jgi:hypothetical protein
MDSCLAGLHLNIEHGEQRADMMIERLLLI